jgi:hypothetical protein
MKRIPALAIPVFHLVFIAVLLVMARNAPVGDWGNYYYGSKLFSFFGGSIKAYDVDTFNHFAEISGGEKMFLSYTQVPPLTILVFYPFTFFSIGIAKILFLLISYLFCAVAVFKLFKKLNTDLRWTLLLPLLLFLPMKSNIDQGQLYFLLIGLLSFGWLARENGKLILAGFLFALAIHLKIFPAIILIWLLFEKDWRTFGITICAVLVLFLGSLLCIEGETWNYYGTVILPRLAKGEITNTYASIYQSMQVMLKQLFVPDALHNPTAPFDSVFAFRFGNLLWTGIVLFATILFSLDKKQDSFSRFSIWLLAGMLISGYGSTYGLLLLVFPLIFILQSKEIPQHKKAILLVLVLLVCNIPVTAFMNLHFPFSFLRLWLMIIFSVMLFYFFRPRINYFALAGFAVLLLLLNRDQQEQGSKYFLKKEPSLLVTDFSVSGDSILYTYRDVDGLHRSFSMFPEHITESKIKDEDKYYIYIYDQQKDFPGEQVTEEMTINNKYLLYLSDRNRGPGFTTIRIKGIGK